MSEIAPKPVSPSRTKRLIKAWPILVLLAGLGVWQRESIWIWYCVERMERAAPDDRALWAERLANCQQAAVPALLKAMRHDDGSVCSSARMGLAKIFATINRDEQAEFVAKFAAEEPRFSTPGRLVALEMLPTLFATKSPEADALAKSMIAACVKSDSIESRIQAIVVVLESNLPATGEIKPLLDDPQPEVRRAAILALGPHRDEVSGKSTLEDDELLKCLNDTDSEVRRLCEMSLKGRGRSDRDIRLGKKFASRIPADRLRLLVDLADEDEFDVTVWLDKLTADHDPAVRAGAVRVAADKGNELSSRIEKLANEDPDSTVRRIANYYRQRLLAANNRGSDN